MRFLGFRTRRNAHITKEDHPDLHKVETKILEKGHKTGTALM